MYQGLQDSRGGPMPSRSPTLAIEPRGFPDSARSSKTIATARSRSSAGCCFRDVMSPYFPRSHSLQGTRGSSVQTRVKPAFFSVAATLRAYSSQSSVTVALSQAPGIGADGCRRWQAATLHRNSRWKSVASRSFKKLTACCGSRRAVLSAQKTHHGPVARGCPLAAGERGRDQRQANGRDRSRGYAGNE